jgi:hypothetical protein
MEEASQSHVEKPQQGPIIGALELTDTSATIVIHGLQQMQYQMMMGLMSSTITFRDS